MILDSVCVGQNIRKMAAAVVYIHVARFQISTLAVALRHVVPIWCWQSHLYFPVQMVLPARDNLSGTQWLLCCLADFFKKAFLAIGVYELDQIILKGIPFFFFFFWIRMKNVLIRGRNSTESVSVFYFLHGPTRYFYPNWASSKNLASTLVCSYFCFYPTSRW